MCHEVLYLEIHRPPNTLYLRVSYGSQQTEIISLYSINWLVFITETECLLRGTDWFFIIIIIIIMFVKG
jgi:hypothetical protein